MQLVLVDVALLASPEKFDTPNAQQCVRTKRLGELSCFCFVTNRKHEFCLVRVLLTAASRAGKEKGPLRLSGACVA